MIRGQSELISGLKADCYYNQALNIISRVKSTWPDYPLLGLMPLVGGGIVNISGHLQRELDAAAAPVADPVWSNVSGYLKFGKRGVWLREAVRFKFGSGEIRPAASVAAPLSGLPAVPVPFDQPVDGEGGSVDERFDRLAGRF